MADLYTTLATSSYRSIQLPADDLQQSIDWNGDGTVNFIDVSYAGFSNATPAVVTNNVTYRQRFTYTAGVVTTISQWTPQ